MIFSINETSSLSIKYRPFLNQDEKEEHQERLFQPSQQKRSTEIFITRVNPHTQIIDNTSLLDSFIFRLRYKQRVNSSSFVVLLGKK